MDLVTGGTGFVGSAVVRRLLAAGRGVRALVRPGSRNLANLEGLDVEVVEGDLLDPDGLAAAADGCEGLYHVAADYRLWTRDPAQMFRTNVDGTVALVRAAQAAGVRRIVYTSSVAVLGLHDDGRPADETTPVRYEDMIGPYKRSKFRAEEAVMRLVRDEGAPVVVVNPSTPIGPRDIRPTPTGRVIVEAASGRIPAFVDTGLNVAHVDDIAEGHLQAFRHGGVGERYVLGGEDMSLAEILGVVAGECGRTAPRIRLPQAAILPIAYAAEAWCRLSGGNEPFVTVDGVRMSRKKMFFSSAKAEQDLGYLHRPAQEAICDAVAWFRDNRYLDRVD